MPYDTLEKAQERILELEDQLANVTTERDTLSQDNESLKVETESLRTLNQKYFNRLIAQDNPKEDEKEESEVPSCEEFAKTLNF